MDMKLLNICLFFIIFSSSLAAQEESVPVLSDTTVYEVVENLPYPLMNSCVPKKGSNWTVDSIRQCGERTLLGLLASNIRYPQEARDKNIQGTVVLNFIVEPTTNRITHITLLRDIGGGCGEEAIRVLKALDEAGLRWAPAANGGKPVRMKYTLPLKFKLQEALPYYISSTGDSIYTVLDTTPQFAGGDDSLAAFVINRLQYPNAWRDSCKAGIFEMALLVRNDGAIRVDNVLDFSNLGLDFQWEAQRLALKTVGMWKPATLNGKAVTTTLPLRVVFKSDAPGCKTVNDNFDKAMLLADEGAALLAENKPDDAIAKWTEALKLHPDNCELLYYRGTTYLNQNKRDEACQDFNRVKQILGITWFEEIRKLVCGW